MIGCLYMVIVLCATTFGAIAGLGGGVIIKPIFDLIGYHDASTIGVYSCFAVFTMCIVSIIKQVKKGFKFDIKTVLSISIGSLLGGLIGENIFNSVTHVFSNNMVKAMQAILLAFVLVLILLYSLNKEKIRHYNINNVTVIFIIGMILGLTSIFLGIGGGPLNVAFLMIFFSYDMKEAAVYSIATIFFSQISKLGLLTTSGTLMSYDLSLIPVICISAVLGGFIGTLINQKLSNKKIEKIYNGLMLILLGISIYNFYINIV